MLPSGWTKKESKSRPGTCYYLNNFTQETQWEIPTAPAEEKDEKVQASHILKKHKGSRRPSSWRCEVITQSKNEAIDQILAIKARLEECLRNNGHEAMCQLFSEIAMVESDCSSANRGGDLGVFGRGQMQKSFEESTYNLEIGELSSVVDSDSGIHIILRTK